MNLILRLIVVYLHSPTISIAEPIGYNNNNNNIISRV